MGSPLIFDAPDEPRLTIFQSDHLFPIRRIFCVGRNYEAHAREMGVAVDRSAPFYFTKSRDAFVASGSTIAYPPGTANYHYEMELVVAIGAPAHSVSEQDALACVFGYACGLDMTRRDLQMAAREKQRPWDLGKDFEQSAVLAPIVPAETSGHIEKGAIFLTVNGAERQRADVAQLIHPTSAIIADLSLYYHLEPGDLIFTGTPEGVGPVKSGDKIEGGIDGLPSVSLTIA